jgi:hypothetical protein
MKLFWRGSSLPENLIRLLASGLWGNSMQLRPFFLHPKAENPFEKNFMRLALLFFFLSVLTQISFGQSAKIHTADIENFWSAFDRVKATADAHEQDSIIQRLYLDKASPGLKAFIKLRGWTPARFRESMAKNENFWKTVRPKTLDLESQVPEIEKLYTAYKRLYKNFVAPDIYFVIGYVETGGTTTQTQLLIGTEIAAADSTVDSNGLHPMIQQFMRSNQGVLSIVAHERTHTQQKGGDLENRRQSNLLGFCLAEGSCDFIAELLTHTPIERPYMVYGRSHERELWAKFKSEMQGKTISNWLYNSAFMKKGDADLGYYIGYMICKSYYEQATDKELAIREIIELDLENVETLNTFLKDSGYNPQ